MLDIEGTTGSAAHVRDVLFPYATQRLSDWFVDHRGTPAWSTVLENVGRCMAVERIEESDAISVLIGWAENDVKAPPLKRLQGLIWAKGYADGSLRGHVYEDVPGALKRWTDMGISLYVYSSGSVAAQRQWFSHSNHGDLSSLISGHFDLDTAGSKEDPHSYLTISQKIKVRPERTLFLSDSAGELKAARAAGWQAIGIRRADDPRGSAIPGQPVAASLEEVQLE